MRRGGNRDQIGAQIFKHYRWDSEKYVRDALRAAYPPGNDSAWAQVIAAYRVDPARRNKLALLDRLLGASHP